MMTGMGGFRRIDVRTFGLEVLFDYQGKSYVFGVRPNSAPQLSLWNSSDNKIQWRIDL